MSRSHYRAAVSGDGHLEVRAAFALDGILYWGGYRAYLGMPFPELRHPEVHKELEKYLAQQGYTVLGEHWELADSYSWVEVTLPPRR